MSEPTLTERMAKAIEDGIVAVGANQEDTVELIIAQAPDIAVRAIQALAEASDAEIEAAMRNVENAVREDEFHHGLSLSHKNAVSRARRELRALIAAKTALQPVAWEELKAALGLLYGAAYMSGQHGFGMTPECTLAMDRILDLAARTAPPSAGRVVISDEVLAEARDVLGDYKRASNGVDIAQKELVWHDGAEPWADKAKRAQDMLDLETDRIISVIASGLATDHAPSGTQ